MPEDVVPAAPARKHVKLLLYRGMSTRQVSRASNVPQPTIVQLLHEDARRRWGSIGRAHSERLLAVPLPERGAVKRDEPEVEPILPEPEESVVDVDEDTLRAARRTVAHHAKDADDLRLLLTALGIGSGGKS